ncbi:hypothetical protein COCMIDRAFT_90333, partial [Bipolaris oryzae ATCC 44560]
MRNSDTYSGIKSFHQASKFVQKVFSDVAFFSHLRTLITYPLSHKEKLSQEIYTIVGGAKTDHVLNAERQKKAKTYDSGDSLVVTHLTTNPPVNCLY